MDIPERQIAIHGAYSNYNYGDILLIALCTQWIKSCRPHLSIGLPLASDKTRHLIRADTTGLGCVFSGEALIYAGGGYFGEPPWQPLKRTLWGFRNYARHIPLGELVRIRHKPIAIIGVGVGPLLNPIYKKAILRLVDYANPVAVRDEESREYLVSHGISSTRVLTVADAALTLTPSDLPAFAVEAARTKLREALQPTRIGLHLQLPPGYEVERTAILGEIVNYLRMHQDVAVFLLSDNLEISKFQWVKSQVLDVSSQFIFVPCNNHWELSALLGSLDVVITTKLHTGIVASGLGTPTIAIPYHPKVLRFFKQIRAEDRCVPIQTLVTGQLSEQLDRDIGAKQRFSISSQVRDRANRNRELISSFVADL